MTVRTPVNVMQSVRAYIEAEWATEAAAVNASISDNVTIPTSWGTVAYSPQAIRDNVKMPALLIAVPSVTTTGHGVTTTAAPVQVSLELHVRYWLQNRQTALTGNGGADSADDYAMIQALHVGAALRSLIYRATQGDLSGHYNALEFVEESPSITISDGGNLIAEGLIVCPLGAWENQ